MNALAIQHENLPLKPAQRIQLSAAHTRLATIGTISQLALHVVSDAHKSAIHNVVTTVAEAEQMKQRYGETLPPAVEEAYTRLTNRYLAAMETILQQYSTRLLATAERTAEASGDANLRLVLRAWLGL